VNDNEALDKGFFRAFGRCLVVRWWEWWEVVRVGGVVAGGGKERGKKSGWVLSLR